MYHKGNPPIVAFIAPANLVVPTHAFIVIDGTHNIPPFFLLGLHHFTLRLAAATMAISDDYDDLFPRLLGRIR